MAVDEGGGVDFGGVEAVIDVPASRTARLFWDRINRIYRMKKSGLNEWFFGRIV